MFHVKPLKSHISGAAHDQTLNRVDRTPGPQSVARSARAGFLHEPERRASIQHLGRRASPQHLGRAGGVNKRQNLSRGKHGIMTAPSGRPRDRRPAKRHRHPNRYTFATSSVGADASPRHPVLQRSRRGQCALTQRPALTAAEFSAVRTCCHRPVWVDPFCEHRHRCPVMHARTHRARRLRFT